MAQPDICSRHCAASYGDPLAASGFSLLPAMKEPKTGASQD